MSGRGGQNRKARRAAAARGRAAAPRRLAESEAEIAARIAERVRRQREARAAYWQNVTDYELLDMRLAESERECADMGGPWFLPMLIEAIPLWVHRHARTDPAVRVERAHRLAEVVAFSQGAAALADPDARGTERAGATAEIFNAIAEGLAIGAYCPGGALFAGRLWQVVGPALRVSTRERCEVQPLNEAYWMKAAE